MKRALASSDNVESAPRHLRPVEAERKGARFAALDHDVARVLGPHRGPAVLYGYLASAWYEFADPQKLAERKKKITPGDWVEVDYRQFMAISGTNAKASIIRWLRILAEETHPCPWGRCGDEHPLIVVHRQGQSRPNRYRKWRCGEDELVIRPRVRSERLSEVARQRVAAGQRLNGILEGSPPGPIAETPDAQLDLLKTHPGGSEVLSQDFHQVSPQDNLTSSHETSERLAPELQEVSPRNARKSFDETSLRGENPKTDSVVTTSGTTAKERAAAIEHVDEADAVACEAVEHVLTLARRADPAYPGERAWRVAKQLAAAVLTVTPADPAAARALLLAAITDRRLIRAANPIGLLIRGVVGTENGADRYLLPSSASPERPTPPRAATTSYTTSTGLPPGLHEALLSALRGREHLSEEWLRERDIPARAVTIARAEVIREEPTSMTPLADALERQDPDAYRARLERILPDLELPAILHVERTLTHPLLLGMCRARLETQLQAPAEGRS